MRLNGFDLNQIVCLHAPLTERSVTRAAERVHLSQSAMSAVLAQLRRHFENPLLVRAGRRLVATPVARSLVEPAGQLIEQAHAFTALAPRSSPGDDRTGAADRRLRLCHGGLPGRGHPSCGRGDAQPALRYPAAHCHVRGRAAGGRCRSVAGRPGLQCRPAAGRASDGGPFRLSRLRPPRPRGRRHHGGRLSVPPPCGGAVFRTSHGLRGRRGDSSPRPDAAMPCDGLVLSAGAPTDLRHGDAGDGDPAHRRAPSGTLAGQAATLPPRTGQRPSLCLLASKPKRRPVLARFMQILAAVVDPDPAGRGPLAPDPLPS